MNQRNLILILLIYSTLGSCLFTQKKIDINGKWYSITKEDGYQELLFDTSVMHLYSEWYSNQGRQSYFIEGDSLRFVETDLAFKINKIDDSTILLVNKHFKDTLFRLIDSVITFHEIDYKNDSIFGAFSEIFYKRATSSWIKHGLMTEEEMRESILDPSEIEEELIPIKRK